MSQNHKFETKEFKDLRDLWYKKLKKKGFNDIEQDEDNLKLWSSRFFVARYNDVIFKAKEDYYRMAGQHLHEYKFDTKAERLIWELHSDGTSIREIIVRLKKLRLKPSFRDGVQEVIKKHFELMTAKYAR